MHSIAPTVPGGLLRDAAVMLGVALVFVMIFRRLRLGATLGYIVAGAVIGPSVLGLFNNPEAVQRVSEVGIALLLFIVGLELQPSRLWRLRRDIFGLGFAQVVICGLAISLLLYFAPGFSARAALAIGLPLALSSTAQVLPWLRSENELNSPQGERAFSILLFQDLSIVPLITIIAAIAPVRPDPSAPVGWTLALYTVVAVILLVAFGRLVLNPALRFIGRLRERELFVVA
ncbi:MAG TPA: cation:proton antiporter, partial [Sphingomicrobium sp.]|nr:cation:proton antiporter [Sphingomicrobium sp.]